MSIEYKDYYAVLGLKKGASAEEIKQAYRVLAKQHHPDLHPEKHKARAEERFKAINEAYEVLSNPEKKEKYDSIGPGWNSQRHAGPAQGPVGNGESFSGFSDFFEELFGDAGRHGFGVRDASPAGAGKGQDVEAELPLSLEDALHGGDKRISMMLGATGGEKTITVHLPRHIVDGAKLRLRGQGGPAARGGQPGDLFLRIKLLPHPRFKVSGSDLETTVTVMPWTAALGGEAAVETLEGVVRIKIPLGTHAGRPFRIPGKGLGKEGSSRGDLYATVRIDIPDSKDERMEGLYREMREADLSR